MAVAKKSDAPPIQTELTTQAEWDEFFNKEGIIVVDVYQEWCGPCIAMQTLLKKLKIDNKDGIIHFAMAEAKQFEQFKEYEGNSEPTWLFYTNKTFLGTVRGANAPLMVYIVKELVEMETKRAEGQGDIKMIQDLLGERNSSEEKRLDRRSSSKSVLVAKIDDATE